MRHLLIFGVKKIGCELIKSPKKWKLTPKIVCPKMAKLCLPKIGLIRKIINNFSCWVSWLKNELTSHELILIESPIVILLKNVEKVMRYFKKRNLVLRALNEYSFNLNGWLAFLGDKCINKGIKKTIINSSCFFNSYTTLRAPITKKKHSLLQFFWFFS